MIQVYYGTVPCNNSPYYVSCNDSNQDSMDIFNYLKYIIGYVKACKIKNDGVMGSPYIMVQGTTLLCCDSFLSTYFKINIEYCKPFIICNRLANLNVLDEECNYINLFDIHIYNIMSNTLSFINNPYLNFIEIEDMNQDNEIPSKSSDPAFKRIYCNTEGNSLSYQTILYNFYNMMPLSKSDTYKVEIAKDNLNPTTSIVKYKVFKKKPKCEIEVYRRVINLM